MNYEGSSAVLQFCSQEGSAVLQFCSFAVLQLVESDHWNYFVNFNMEKSLAVLQSLTLKGFSLLLTPYSLLIARLFLPAQLNQCLFQRFFRPDEIVFPPELLIIRTQLVGKKFIQPGSFP
jgi:hypothetical protein